MSAIAMTGVLRVMAPLSGVASRQQLVQSHQSR